MLSLILLAMIPPREKPKPETGATGNEVIRRATVTGPSELKAFLRMNPEEGFDVEAVNALDFRILIKEAGQDKRLLHEAVRTAEAILPRVRAETEDPLLVGAILSDKTLAWFRKSPADPDWAEFVPLRWGGIFFESRAPGGRLRRKLSTRIVDLINECVNASGTTAVLRAGFSGMFRGSKNVKSALQFALGSKRPRLTQQVAQAFLDDLAAVPRNGNHPLPLAHLSDLARRAGSAEVNNTLSEIFHPENTRILTVVDSRFHPEMHSIVIRIVPAKNPEEPSTYDLVLSDGEPTREARAAAAAGDASDSASASPWERPEMTGKEWLKVLKTLERKKARLDPPPAENHREGEAYLGLRDLLLTDAAARKAFLLVRWKGRPTGLPLLCQLLSQGTWVPEADTDGDYLEAELGHLDAAAKGDAWNLPHGWKVSREMRPGGVRAYTARAPSAG